MRYRASVDGLGQRLVFCPIVLHPLYKPPEFTGLFFIIYIIHYIIDIFLFVLIIHLKGVVSTSLGEMYMLHRILLDLMSEKGYLLSNLLTMSLNSFIHYFI